MLDSNSNLQHSSDRPFKGLFDDILQRQDDYAIRFMRSIPAFRKTLDEIDTLKINLNRP